MRPGGTEEQKYFNPRSPHGERRNPTGSGISERHFNPRSPHGERPALTAAVSSGEKFQSTLPARGATLRADGSKSGYTHFNPRSPHGERRQGARKASVRGYFNPRSPHGERLVVKVHMATATVFQSTLPARGATLPSGWRNSPYNISIHAPRTGSDGGQNSAGVCFAQFQSTLPARGATLIENFRKTAKTFQSTLPARGATGAHGCTWLQPRYFNPRSPHGERPDRQQLNAVN